MTTNDLDKVYLAMAKVYHDQIKFDRDNQAFIEILYFLYYDIKRH